MEQVQGGKALRFYLHSKSDFDRFLKLYNEKLMLLPSIGEGAVPPLFSIAAVQPNGDVELPM